MFWPSLVMQSFLHIWLQDYCLVWCFPVGVESSPGPDGSRCFFLVAAVNVRKTGEFNLWFHCCSSFFFLQENVYVKLVHNVYVNLLGYNRFYNKDQSNLRSAKYVCPPTLSSWWWCTIMIHTGYLTNWEENPFDKHLDLLSNKISKHWWRDNNHNTFKCLAQFC